MFITQIKSLKNTEFWRYLLGSLIVILCSFLGQIPITIGWLIKTGSIAELQNTPQSKLMHLLDSNTTLFLLMLTFIFAMLGLWFVVTKLHRHTFKTIVTSRLKVDYKRIAFAFLVYGFFVLISTYIGYKAEPENYEWNFQIYPFLGLVLLGVLLFPIQIGVEELVFRGYLLQGFAKLANNRLFALLMTSVIFGTLHITNPEVQEMGYIVLVYYIGTGLFLGLLTLMDNGTELALGFHLANNLLQALLVTADWTAIQTNSVLKDISPDHSVGLEVLTPVIIVYPILVLVFSKKYDWTDWKSKLFGSV